VDVPGSVRPESAHPGAPEIHGPLPRPAVEVQFNDRIIDLIEEQVDVTVRGAPSITNLIARRIVNTRLLHLCSPEYLHE